LPFLSPFGRMFSLLLDAIRAARLVNAEAAVFISVSTLVPPGVASVLFAFVCDADGVVLWRGGS